LIFHYGWKRGTRFSFVVVLGFALVLGPWIARNMITLRILSDRTLMVKFLHHGIYPNFTFDNVKVSYGYPYRYDHRSKKISKDISTVFAEIVRRFHQKTFKHIKWFLFGKPVAFWSWDNVQGILRDVFIYPVSRSPYFSNKYFQWSHMFMHTVHWPLVLLCMFGCIFVWFPGSSIGLSVESVFVARFVSLLLIYYTLIHMVGAPFPRYSIPLRPFLYGMAVFSPYLFFTAVRKFREF
jgi:hypothetical protein